MGHFGIGATPASTFPLLILGRSTTHIGPSGYLDWRGIAAHEASVLPWGPRIHAQDLIRHGQSVIFEKGLWLRSERDEKRREARELDVDIEVHYFDVPIDELARRLEKRNSEGNTNAFSIAREQLEEHFKSFEPPDEAERTASAGLRTDSAC